MRSYNLDAEYNKTNQSASLSFSLPSLLVEDDELYETGPRGVQQKTLRIATSY